MATTFTDAPWESPEGKLSAQDYCSVSLINQNDGPREKWVKGACKLPIRATPGGAVNTHAMQAAKAALGGARGGITASGEEKGKAGATLDRLYKELTAQRSRKEEGSMDGPEYKVCYDTRMEIKDGAGGNGIVEGYFAVFNVEDRDKDVIVPGAFRETIPDLLRDGVILARHGRGNDQPIATIADVKETGVGGRFVAEYHSTDFAQQERTIAQERLSRGKTVANSFGYRVPKGGSEYKAGGGRYLRTLNVFEITSNTHIPSQPLAQILSVKERPLDGLTMAEHTDSVLGALEEWTERMGGIEQLGLKEGRMLSGLNVGRLRDMHGNAKSLIAMLEELLTRANAIAEEEAAAEEPIGGKELEELVRKEFIRFQASKLLTFTRNG